MAAGLCAAFAPQGNAGGPPLALGATVRITTPGTSLCPAEGEPETTVTRIGTWVAYNDDHQCPLTPGFNRVEEVQLINGQGKTTFIPLTAPAGQVISGDPDLAPAPDGGVYLAALWQESSGALGIRILHITAKLHVTQLPTPSYHGANTSDDKEFIAVDLRADSRFYGHIYVVWDDFNVGSTVMRAWTGAAWSKPVVVGHYSVSGTPDVAVGPKGVVAVTLDSDKGAVVRFSHDGGRTLTEPQIVIKGTDPGRTDPNCPLRPTVGVRQRALMGPRVTFDRPGDLHVVAAIGDFSEIPTAPDTAVGTATVWHAVLHDERVVHAERVTAPSSDEQWAGVIAAMPTGGVALSWLQTNGPAFSTYDAWIAVQRAGARTFSAPQRLSTSSGYFPAATEAVGNSNCYGIGDYIGMWPTARGVETVWPTTQGTEPGVDSDVLLRFATAR
jgi:hypothetical protein